MMLFQDRSIISVKGQDTLQFLQGLTTNDIEKSSNSYNYLLSPQGRYLYDFFVSSISDKELLIEVDSSCVGGLLQRLNLYKLRRDVLIEDKSAQYEVLYSKALVEDAVVSYQDPRFHKLGFRTVVLSKTTNHMTSLRGLAKPEAISVGYDDITPNLLRLQRRREVAPPRNDVVGLVAPRNDFADLYIHHKYQYAIPDGVTDLIFDRSIPSHYGAEELCGISFTKGCYVGQEVISRAKYQGVMRQKIFKIISGTEIALEKGAEVTDIEGSKIGILCSNYGKLGIALLNEEKYLGLEEKVAIMGDGLKAKIEVPEWRVVV